jgi:hypothetical protein
MNLASDLDVVCPPMISGENVRIFKLVREELAEEDGTHKLHIVHLDSINRISIGTKGWDEDDEPDLRPWCGLIEALPLYVSQFRPKRTYNFLLMQAELGELGYSFSILERVRILTFRTSVSREKPQIVELMDWDAVDYQPWLRGQVVEGGGTDWALTELGQQLVT